VSDASHLPVLLEETIDAVTIRAPYWDSASEAGLYVDATFGRGGHARALLTRLGPADRLLAIDRDPAAVQAGELLMTDDSRFSVHRARFSELADVLAREGFSRVRAVIMDLGVSSPQLDEAARGFSFRARGPIDMRMDPDSGESAGDWLNAAEEKEISRVIRNYGEERFANRIAAAIVRARPLEDTQTLAEVIRGAIPGRHKTHRRGARGEKKRDDATRSFQAIRMHVNEELEEIEAGLHAAFEVLEPGGRLAVISFHSLEDRTVKRSFRGLASGPKLPKGLPVRASEVAPEGRLVGGPIRAGSREVAANPRARSATLRVLERSAAQGVMA
jgi:16S rRNA (cytosine1402-N4)-methyltransferase